MRVWIFANLVALSAIACGPDCAALCENAKDCDGAEVADDEVRGGDCEKRCEEAEKQAEGAGCESQYEEALSCTNDLEDVCQPEDCAEEQKALTECVAK